MVTVVTRLFADMEKADAAIAELKNEYFGSMDYTIVTNDSSFDTAEDALKNAGVRARDAAGFAQGVRAGNTAVVVRAPFGTAGTAIFILDHFGPVEVPASRGQVMVNAGRRSPPPLSGATILSGPGMPATVQWRTPFEYFFWAPSIIRPKPRPARKSGKGSSFSTILTFPQILKNKKPAKPLKSGTFSAMIGLPTTIKYRSKTHVS